MMRYQAPYKYPVCICDALGEFAAKNSLQNLGLLGTRFTMERDFFRDRLSKNHITVSIPGKLQRCEIHRIIYETLPRRFQ